MISARRGIPPERALGDSITDTRAAMRRMIVTIGGGGGSTDAQHWTAGLGCGFDVSGQPVRRVPFAVSTASTYEAHPTVSADNEVFCLSCHKAHGSVHAFGMQWPYGGERQRAFWGSSGCNQCHKSAGA